MPPQMAESSACSSYEGAHELCELHGVSNTVQVAKDHEWNGLSMVNIGTGVRQAPRNKFGNDSSWEAIGSWEVSQ